MVDFPLLLGVWQVDGTTVSHQLDACSKRELIGQTLLRTIDFMPEGQRQLSTAP
ncbi:MAG: hypothetical protein ACSLE1_15405 [Sphingobium sp.]